MIWITEQYQYFSAWYAAGGEGPQQLWLYGGATLVLVFLIVSYYLLRRQLGQRKFRGTWYNEAQWQQLLQMTHEDQQRGNRVLRRDEVEMLRKWKLGRAKGFGRDSGWGL